jgi:hypothetical protein
MQTPKRRLRVILPNSLIGMRSNASWLLQTAITLLLALPKIVA